MRRYRAFLPLQTIPVLDIGLDHGNDDHIGFDSVFAGGGVDMPTQFPHRVAVVMAFVAEYLNTDGLLRKSDLDLVLFALIANILQSQIDSRMRLYVLDFLALLVV